MAQDTVTENGVAQELKVLKEDFRTLKSDVRDLISAVGGSSKNRFEDLKAWVAESAQRIRERAGEQAQHAYKVARDTSQQAVEKSREQIKERPLSYVGAAFAVGLILGVLIRRR